MVVGEVRTECGCSSHTICCYECVSAQPTSKQDANKSMAAPSQHPQRPATLLSHTVGCAGRAFFRDPINISSLPRIFTSSHIFESEYFSPPIGILPLPLPPFLVCSNLFRIWLRLVISSILF